MTTETEKSIKALEPEIQRLTEWIAQDPPFTSSKIAAERVARLAALRHLISEARKVERVREWCHNTSEGFASARVLDIILAATDTEGGAK